MAWRYFHAGVVGAFVLAFGAVAEELTAPVYRLEVGELIEVDAEIKFDRGHMTERTEITLQLGALDHAGDGAWNVIVSREIAKYAVYPDDEHEGHRIHEDRGLFSFVLHPDGRVEASHDVVQLGLLYEVFKPLPRNAEEAEEGWSFFDPVLGVEYDFETVRASDSELVFREARRESFDPVYLASVENTIYFDVEDGLPRRIEHRGEQGWGMTGRYRGSFTFKRVGPVMPEEELALIWEDYQRLEEARAAFRERELALMARADYSEELVDQARHALLRQQLRRVALDAKEDMKTDAFLGDIDALASQVDYKESFYDQVIAYRSERIGRPAPPWELVSYDGATHALEDFKGRPVVLLFWHRGCPWCIRTLDYLKREMETFDERGVKLIGMNTDLLADNGQFVVNTLEIPFLNLRAHEVADEYGVEVSPKVMILDAGGVLREVFWGFTYTDRARIWEVLDEIAEPEHGDEAADDAGAARP